MLDVNGRMRVRATTAQTAGIGFDGGTVANPLIDRGFIGMLNNDYVGLYGSGGAGWGMAMNVNNGFVGIGIATPGAQLDIRSSSAGSGLYVGKSGEGAGINVSSSSAYPALNASNSNGPAIATQGRVGVNVAYPNSTLQVGGSVTMPVKIITDNYTATANDYSIQFVPTSKVGQYKTLKLPDASTCLGRIYVISASIEFHRGPNNGSALFIADHLGNTIYDGHTYRAILYHQKVDYGSSDYVYPGERHLSITLQSAGSKWIIIDNDFFSE